MTRLHLVPAISTRDLKQQSDSHTRKPVNMRTYSHDLSFAAESLQPSGLFACTQLWGW